MGKSIFEFGEKLGYESPFGDWVESDFTKHPDNTFTPNESQKIALPPGTPPELQGVFPQILRERYNAMQTPPWNWSGAGYSREAQSTRTKAYTINGNNVEQHGQNYYMPYWLERPVGSKDAQDAAGNPLGDIVVLLGVKIQTTITQGSSYTRNNFPAWAGVLPAPADDHVLFPGGPLPGFAAVAVPPGLLGWAAVGVAPVVVTAANPMVFMYNGIGNAAGYTFAQAIEFSIALLAYLIIRNLVQLQLTGVAFLMSDVTNNFVELNVVVTYVIGSLSQVDKDTISANLETSFGGGSPRNVTIVFNPVPIGGAYLTINNFEVSFPKPTNKKGLGIQSLIFR